MNTSVTLAFANAEVNHIFTRKLPDNRIFYGQVIQKINALQKKVKEQQVYALLVLHQHAKSIKNLTQSFYDAMDKYEGLLEKKKHLKGKAFHFPEKFQQTLPFDSSLAADLVALFEIYDRLVSTLKVTRLAGCFMDDGDYWHHLRGFFRSVNQLLSNIQLTSLKSLPAVTFEEVINDTEIYRNAALAAGPVDLALLGELLTSRLSPGLEEKIRQALLQRLKKRHAIETASSDATISLARDVA